ncbi:MAG: hypothetical protein IJY47_07405 [Clostridia bacterium]|nr:hypothetical protein [Clostridia bacterium]
MKNKKLSSIALLLLLPLLLSACGSENSLPTVAEPPEDSTSPPSSALLGETEDFGQSYLDSFVFFGESTTYHLKNRGVLKGGTETKQVWGPDGGTVNLDGTIGSLVIRYPETEELLTLSQALSRKKPSYLLLCFGLNGAPQKLRGGAEAYKKCYRLLLDTVKQSSPETKVILQSAFPVAENMDMSAYSMTLDQLNGAIETINGWTLELAEEYGMKYLNTAEILKDEQGRLHMEYQSGDGYHLTREAYLLILRYIRTHGWK